MNCSEVQEVLSAYYDGGLAADRSAAIEEHLATCVECPRLLREIETLSHMAAGLADPQPPDELWSAIELSLGGETVVSPPAIASRRFRSNRMYAIAIAAIALMAFVSIWLNFPDADEHAHLAVNFDHYLDEFPSDPAAAQQILLAKYDHKAVDLDEAVSHLRYRPAATMQLPNGYSLDNVYVFKMPCCTCVQALYKNENGESLALFEHDSDQPLWFGERPAITCSCKGRKTKIVPFDGKLAASWPSGMRHLTAVGVRDIEQVVALVGHFNDSAGE